MQGSRCARCRPGTAGSRRRRARAGQARGRRRAARSGRRVDNGRSYERQPRAPVSSCRHHPARPASPGGSRARRACGRSRRARRSVPQTRCAEPAGSGSQLRASSAAGTRKGARRSQVGRCAPGRSGPSGGGGRGRVRRRQREPASPATGAPALRDPRPRSGLPCGHRARRTLRR